MHEKRLKKYEKILTENPQLARVCKSTEQLGEDILGKSAWYVLAPSLNIFVIWTLQQATEKQIKRLYFMARDGYLMFKIAKKICEEMKLDIECRYFYSSRFSLRTALYHLDLEQALDYICAYGLETSLEVILDRTGLDKSKQAEIIRNLNIGLGANEDIPFSRIKEVRQSLAECELFTSALMEHSKSLTPALLGYLRQEGMLDDVKSALVDSGWVGSTQKTINQALSQLGAKKEVTGLYWGLFYLPSKKDQKDYYSYYFEPKGSIKEKIYFSNSLFEAIFTAPHGSTTGYGLTEGKYIPIYLESQKEKVDFTQKLEKVLLHYTELLLMDINEIGEIDTLRAKKTIYQLLRLFMGKPTQEEAEYFGNLIFSDAVDEKKIQRIATSFSDADVRGYQLIFRVLTMLGFRRAGIKVSGWAEGSMVLYGKRVNYHLLQLSLYKRLSFVRMKLLWKLRKQ